MQCIQRQPKRTKSEELLHNEKSNKVTRLNVKLLGKFTYLTHGNTCEIVRCCVNYLTAVCTCDCSQYILRHMITRSPNRHSTSNDCMEAVVPGISWHDFQY